MSAPPVARAGFAPLGLRPLHSEEPSPLTATLEGIHVTLRVQGGGVHVDLLTNGTPVSVFVDGRLAPPTPF